MWRPVQELVFNRGLRDKVIEKTETYRNYCLLAEHRRSNFPMLFIKSANIQKLLDLKKHAGEHEGSRAMINQLMEEYHTLINEIIDKYPGSLNLSGTKYQDHRIFYVLNTLGAILRQKIIKLLY